MPNAVSFSALCPTCHNEVSQDRMIEMRLKGYSERTSSTSIATSVITSGSRAIRSWRMSNILSPVNRIV